MTIIRYIPGILSLTSALLVILASMQQSIRFNVLCLRVSIFMISFYVLGIIAEKILSDIFLYEKSKKEKEVQIQNELRQSHAAEEKEDETFTPLKVNKIDGQDAKILAKAIKTASYQDE